MMRRLRKLHRWEESIVDASVAAQVDSDPGSDVPTDKDEEPESWMKGFASTAIEDVEGPFILNVR